MSKPRWIACALVLLLAACATVPNEGSPEGASLWDYSCRITLIDDVGLPDHRISELELNIMDGGRKTLHAAWRSNTNVVEGKLRRPATADDLHGELFVYVDVPGGQIVLQRLIDFGTPEVSADGVLQLKAEIHASDISPRAQLVRGRVLAAGEPLGNASVLLDPPRPGGNTKKVYARTDGEGLFIAMFEKGASVEFYGVRSPYNEFAVIPRRPWRIAVGADGGECEFDWFETSAKPEGEHFSLGDCTCPGGLLTVAGTARDCIVTVQSGTIQREAFHLPATFLVPPGRYSVAVESGGDYPGEPYVYRHCIQDVHGGEAVTAQPAQVDTGELRVRLQTPDGEPPRGVMLQGRLPVESGVASLPMHPEGLWLTATGDGYESAEMFVPPVLDEVLLTLEPKRIPAAVVKPIVKKDGRFQLTGWDILAVHESGDYVWYSSQSRSLLELQAAGKWKLYLLGGESFGYPGGLMAEPAVVDTADPETLQPKFHLKPAPTDAASWWNTTGFRCAGADVGLDGVRTRTAIDSPVNWRPGEISQPFPTALIDGDHDIPLEFTDDYYQPWQAELPPRVHLKLTGFVPDYLNVFVYLRSLEPGSQGRCSSRIRGGEANLWLPPGPAELTVEGGGTFFRQRVEISTDAVLQVEHEMHWATVEFDVGWDESVPDELRIEHTDWSIESVDDENVRLEIFPDADWGHGKYLLPLGRYRARCLSARFAGEREFELGEGEGTRIRLGDVTLRRRADVTLAMPAAIGLGAHHGCFTIDGVDFAWCFTDKGLQLKDVPVDSVGRLSGWFQTGGRSWWLEPLAVSGESSDVLPADWRPGCWGNPRWSDIRGDPRIRLHEGMAWLRPNTRALPTGDFEAGFRVLDHDDVVSLHIADDAVLAPIPDELLKELQRRRLLRNR